MRVYTLGTSDREPYEFTKILSKYGINVVFDVRRFPASQHPHFRRDRLGTLCASQGTEYVFLGNELGDFRDEGDQVYIASHEFKRGIDMITRTAATRVCCVLCAERLPDACHRRHIAQALEKRGIETLHILDETSLWTARPKQRPPRRRG